MDTIKKTFEVETSPSVMRRFERFLALLHHNSNFGHSGTFAMPLDGDGSDKVKITPTPEFAREVDLAGGIGYDIEIAYDDSFSGVDINRQTHDYTVKPSASLYKDGELVKTIG